MSNEDEIIREQTAIWIPPDAGGRLCYSNRRDGYTRHFYCHMLMEDVGVRIVPYLLNDDAEENLVDFTTDDEAGKDIVAMAFSQSARRHSYHSRSLVHDVREFLRLCVAEIFIVGRATYELVLHRDRTGKFIGFNLFFIDGASIVYADGKIFQKIPQWLADKQGLPTMIPLPAKRLVVFDEPPHFKGHLGDVMDVLAEGSGLLSPSFAMSNLAGNAPHVPYNFTLHHTTLLTMVADATRKIGWNARGSFSEHITDCYFVSRQLRFHQFLIEMREHMLKKLNEAIRLAGNQIGFSTELKLSGLPTEHDIKVAHNHLSHGTASFADILKPFEGS